MKTVKDYICSLDKDFLAEVYFREYGKSLSTYYYGSPFSDEVDERIKTMTVSEFAEDEIRQIREYIEYLKGIEITENEDGKHVIIYACSTLDGDFINTAAVCMERLLADPEACGEYDFMFTKFSEILGFLVADNTYTQDHIYKVISDVLWEASLTGYRQERLQEDLEKFEGHYEPEEDPVVKLLGDDYYREVETRMSRDTEDRRKLWEDAFLAKNKYKECSGLRERMILLNALKCDGIGPGKAD